MPPFSNPALDSFLNRTGPETELAQVLIRRTGTGGFELRHVEDRSQPKKNLRSLDFSDLRELVQFTASGQYRPLKSAPNLQKGWILQVQGKEKLWEALNQIYPGAIADWFAAQSPAPPITQFRTFTERQTGMYRITAKLSNAQAASAIKAGCHANFCLKQRLWTVEGLSPDHPSQKSMIPCLEICPLILEFSRKAMRVEQEKKIKMELSESEKSILISALERALTNPDPEIREADFDSPANPRRIKWLLEKLMGSKSESEA